MLNDLDKHFLEKAILMAKESFEKGAFPAGAVIAKGDQQISSGISAFYPKIQLHGESNAIDEAINKLNKQMNDCTLYTSMESCLMCLSRAYWVGIRRIVFAIKKESTNKDYYESTVNTEEVVKAFHEKLEMIHGAELQETALDIVHKWELKNNE